MSNEGQWTRALSFRANDHPLRDPVLPRQRECVHNIEERLLTRGPNLLEQILQSSGGQLILGHLGEFRQQLVLPVEPIKECNEILDILFRETKDGQKIAR